MKTTTSGRSGLQVSVALAPGSWVVIGVTLTRTRPLRQSGAHASWGSILHATKDVELALSAAHRHEVELPLTDALLPRWHQAAAADHGDDDVAAAVTAAATTASPPNNRSRHSRAGPLCRGSARP